MLEQNVQSFSKLVVLQIYCVYIRVDCEGGLYVQVSRVQATRAVSLPDVLEEGGSGRVGNKERSSGRRSKAKVGRQYHLLHYHDHHYHHYLPHHHHCQGGEARAEQ